MLTCGHYLSFLSFSPGKPFLISAGSYSRHISVLNPFDGDYLGTLSDKALSHEGAVAPVQCGVWLSNGQYFISGHQDGLVALWDMQDFKLVHTYPVRDAEDVLPDRLDLALSPDERRLASSSNRSIHIWDAESGDILAYITRDDWQSGAGHLLCAVLQWDRETIVGLSNGAIVYQWSTLTGSLLGCVQLLDTSGHPSGPIGFRSLLSPDGTRVCWVAKKGPKGVVNVSEAFSGRWLWSGVQHAVFDVRKIAFSPNGAMVATSSQDCALRIWAVDDGRKIAERVDPCRAPALNVFSPDSDMLVMGGWDGTVNVFKIKDLIAGVV